LKVMLKSLFINNPGQRFTIYLMHSGIADEDMQLLDQYIRAQDGRLEVLCIEDHYFQDAPTLLHYTKEMYYRLLASKFLPQELDKILYLP